MLPYSKKNTFGFHGDDFDSEMTSWLEETHFDLLDHVDWLATEGIIYEVRVFFFSYL